MRDAVFLNLAIAVLTVTAAAVLQIIDKIKYVLDVCQEISSAELKMLIYYPKSAPQFVAQVKRKKMRRPG